MSNNKKPTKLNVNQLNFGEELIQNISDIKDNMAVRNDINKLQNSIDSLSFSAGGGIEYINNNLVESELFGWRSEELSKANYGYYHYNYKSAP